MRISLQAAADFLKNEQVIAVPTETVYGLAARLSAENAVAEVFRLKGRPSDNPLIIHVSSLQQIEKYAVVLPADIDRLSNAFWPGPMTLVLPVKPFAVPEIVCAGLPTAAFRIPNHPLASQLIKLVGPLVMPSANISGRPSATSPEHVEEDFGPNFPVLDGGTCRYGMESTILIYTSLARWSIIRLGSVSSESFIPVLGYAPDFLKSMGDDKPICPGQLYRHYAPKAKLQLVRSIAADFQGVIVGFSDRSYPKKAHLVTLGPSDKPLKIAENLYSVLRDLDMKQIPSALVDVDFPDEGLWTTILERLCKASGTVCINQ